MKATLYDIAHARSGDKGPNTNVGLILRSQATYDWAKEEIPTERVKGHFSSVVKGEVIRYEMPNLWAFNFILYDSLLGAAARRCSWTPKGKLTVSIFCEWKWMCRRSCYINNQY